MLYPQNDDRIVAVVCVTSLHRMYTRTLDAGQCPALARPAAPLAACVQRATQLHFLPYANAIYRMSPELSSVDEADKNWFATATSLAVTNMNRTRYFRIQLTNASAATDVQT